VSTIQTLTLNGVEVSFREGMTILDVARKNGVRIPTLCHESALEPYGACRICVVEVEGARAPVASCCVPAAQGMAVRTETPRIQRARRAIIELLLSDHPEDCLSCEKAGACSLQEYAYEFGARKSRYPSAEKHNYAALDDNPFYVRDYNKCILCGRCVRTCAEVQGDCVIDFAHRGYDTAVSTPINRGLIESQCVLCGNCVQSCPVGALTEKKSIRMGRSWEMEKVRTTCPYCGVGCQQWLHVKDGKIVKVTGVKNAEPNRGRLCVKGRFGYDFIYSEERLKTPLIREGDAFREATWDEALDLTADKIKEIIKKHGPDAVAGVSCARSINEDSYNMQKLFRSVFKTNNIDHCARV